jgi:SOS response regulatory protein OraA/RecX
VSTREAAFDAGVRALARRELTTAELGDRLRRAGFDEAEREHAISRLRSAGYLDDERAALERARVLAERGAGDAAIAADLCRRGTPDHLVAEALVALEPEVDRARKLATVLGTGPRTARKLGRRGFSEDAIEATVAGDVAEEQ